MLIYSNVTGAIYTEFKDTIMVYYYIFFLHFDKLSRISWFHDKLLQFRIVKIAFFYLVLYTGYELNYFFSTRLVGLCVCVFVCLCFK